MLHTLKRSLCFLGLVLMPSIAVAACPDYALISTRGTFEPQGPSKGFVDMINTTLLSIPNGITYDTVYPASTNLSGAFIGATDIVRFIDTTLRDCPHQKFMLLGYSQGATATNFALNRTFDSALAAYQSILGVIVIGNPGHVNGSKANVDQDGGATTRDYIGSHYFNGLGAIPRRFYDDGKVLDICITGDITCAMPAGSNGTEELSPQHGLYGVTPYVQTLGAEFMIEKLDRALALGLAASKANGSSDECGSSSTRPGGPQATGGATSLQRPGVLVFAAILVSVMVGLM